MEQLQIQEGQATEFLRIQESRGGATELQRGTRDVGIRQVRTRALHRGSSVLAR